uniref:Uncharacterized protein n=1 Tax=Anguilla anguilla TaxID=7936 RepID=A0A0E9VU67_ANGAN
MYSIFCKTTDMRWRTT